MFQHSPETLIDDLLGSIPEVPNIAAMEKAEQDAALVRRPKWDSEPIDIDELLRTTVGEGEIAFEKLSKGAVSSRESSADEVGRIAADALRRMNGEGDDFRKTDDIEPDEADENDEPPAAPPADLHADISYLKAEAAKGTDLWEMTNRMLHTDLPRARELQKALAWIPGAA
jgi:hypothetical protein